MYSDPHTTRATQADTMEVISKRKKINGQPVAGDRTVTYTINPGNGGDRALGVATKGFNTDFIDLKVITRSQRTRTVTFNLREHVAVSLGGHGGVIEYSCTCGDYQEDSPCSVSFSIAVVSLPRG